MGAHGRRLLGWAVHLAFFAAWWQVALLMDRQMHEAPQAAAPAAAEVRLSSQGETPGRQPARAEAAPAAPAEARARAPQLGMRAT